MPKRIKSKIDPKRIVTDIPEKDIEEAIRILKTEKRITVPEIEHLMRVMDLNQSELTNALHVIVPPYRRNKAIVNQIMKGKLTISEQFSIGVKLAIWKLMVIRHNNYVRMINGLGEKIIISIPGVKIDFETALK